MRSNTLKLSKQFFMVLESLSFVNLLFCSKKKYCLYGAFNFIHLLIINVFKYFLVIINVFFIYTLKIEYVTNNFFIN